MGRWGWTWRPGQAVPAVDTAESASSYMGMVGAYGSEIPDPLPEDRPDQPPRTDPPNRPRRFPAVPGTERGRPDYGRQPHITPPPDPGLPDVPEGTLLRLAPGEWAHRAGVHPGDQVTMRVTAVMADLPRTNSSMVWVAGHGIECSWSSSTCVRPCFELLVSVDALWRAVGR